MVRPKPFWSRTMSYAHPLWTRTTSDITAADDTPDLNSILPHTKEAGLDDIYNFTEDVYADEVPAEQEWHVRDPEKKMGYLQHVKDLSNAWPHLRYLAQWMEVTTSPVKWKQLKQLENRGDCRKERAERTKVAIVDFAENKAPDVVETITKSTRLAEFLQMPQPVGVSRLHIVEDLSRDMIEHLGKELDIDPLFFREHINDYWWYNTRDPWVELPDLDIVSRDRCFFRLSYVQPRYFKDKPTFSKAKIQAGMFNVLRRLDDDSEHKALFDEDNAIVGLVRSRVSLWIKPRPAGQEVDFTGVLLIDPSITEGYPLWKGYRPFVNSPTYSQRKEKYEWLRQDCLFDNLCFWLRQMSLTDVKAITSNPHVMIFRMTQIICSDWLILSRYIMARLGQIEWELERPDFRPDSNKIDASLAKLHTWRRRLPLYKSMVVDTQKKLFGDLKPGHEDDCISKMQKDFQIVSHNLQELYDRTERIATVATAVTSIEESRRGMDQNRALGRLTYLAVIFAPLSFVSSFFSMSDDISQLSQTFWIYFTVAVPVSIIAFLLVDPTVVLMLEKFIPGRKKKAD